MATVDGEVAALLARLLRHDADVVGTRAAAVIEGVETHTRTGFAELDLAQIPGIDPRLLEGRDGSKVRVPVTHAKIFGWYDNEYGSYTDMYGGLTVPVHRTMD